MTGTFGIVYTNTASGVIDLENRYLTLVGKGNPLPEDYEIALEDVYGTSLEKTAAFMLKRMFEAALQDGVELKLLSGYRTPEYQREVFDRSVRRRVESGQTYEQAVAETEINVAKPYESEHNLGLAADIVTPDDYDVYEEFENTPQFEWLSNNAATYGFILRYPKGKTDITGYIYEPWHYRYVGPYDAQRIENRDITLEEYLGADQ